MKKRSTKGTSSARRSRSTRQKLIRVTSDELDQLEDKSEWARVASLSDADIEKAIAEDPDAAPLLDDAFWRNAAILDPRHAKSTITIRVDEDVLEFFKGGGSGYQSRMNAVLRAYVYARREKAK